MHGWSREEMEAALFCGTSHEHLPQIECPRTQETISVAIALICEHALGGAMVCIADVEAFKQVFECSPIDALDGQHARPTTRSSDEGYMTDRLHNIHIGDGRFVNAFREFTTHSSNDRWPEDHPDSAARGRPKDGAFLLSKSGYRVKCATKLLGLGPAGKWANVGTRHEAALSCAWAVQGSFVFTRSDSGSVHLILRHGHKLHVYALYDLDKPFKRLLPSGRLQSL
mmetsp:Transcript_119832/g.382526  ORF Transcript_119832/g.382526 Transcript_119832/m.382526 type:complete len:226 (+) Transcript_119832:1369-2046(+)